MQAMAACDVAIGSTAVIRPGAMEPVQPPASFKSGYVQAHQRGKLDQQQLGFLKGSQLS